MFSSAVDVFASSIVGAFGTGGGADGALSFDALRWLEAKTAAEPTKEAPKIAAIAVVIAM